MPIESEPAFLYNRYCFPRRGILGLEIAMKALLILATLLLVLSAPVVSAQIITIPDLGNSIVACAYEDEEAVVLLAVPDGSGRPFTEAFLPSVQELGTRTTDATITLTLIDNFDTPVVNYPREDLWLEASEGDFAPCIGGTVADVATDAGGNTHWAEPIRAGGYSAGRLLVLINGDPAPGEGVPIHVRSPDLNGSGGVDLADVAAFSIDFAAGYVDRSDFNNDSALNLADVGTLASAVGAACP